MVVAISFYAEVIYFFNSCKNNKKEGKEFAWGNHAEPCQGSSISTGCILYMSKKFYHVFNTIFWVESKSLYNISSGDAP